MNEGILAEFAAFSGEDVGCVVPLGAEEGYEGTEEIAGVFILVARAVVATIEIQFAR